MYAIISGGSHQYRVTVGQELDVELQDVPEEASTVDFDRVLLVGDLDEQESARIGRPTVEGAKVTASVLGEVKGSKITIQKHRRRKNSATKKGHRQRYLRVRIDSIEP